MTGTTNQVGQLNLGSGARIAAHNYIETTFLGSVKVYLATTPSEQLDAEAINNERLFIQRFGMDVPRPVREQIIGLKARFDLTDAECRWLRRSGQIRVTRKEARLVPDRLLPAVGLFYALMTAIVFGSGLIAISFATAPAWKQGLVTAVLLSCGIGALWVIDHVFIAPWRRLGLVGAR